MSRIDEIEERYRCSHCGVRVLDATELCAPSSTYWEGHVVPGSMPDVCGPFQPLAALDAAYLLRVARAAEALVHGGGRRGAYDQLCAVIGEERRR